jgi:hypothetical protein
MRLCGEGRITAGLLKVTTTRRDAPITHRKEFQYGEADDWNRASRRVHPG